jgi:hypothetical protein
MFFESHSDILMSKHWNSWIGVPYLTSSFCLGFPKIINATIFKFSVKYLISHGFWQIENDFELITFSYFPFQKKQPNLKYWQWTAFMQKEVYMIFRYGNQFGSDYQQPSKLLSKRKPKQIR